MGHNYGSIDVYAEIHEDGKKELGATIVGEKKNYEICSILSVISNKAYQVKFISCRNVD